MVIQTSIYEFTHGALIPKSRVPSFPVPDFPLGNPDHKALESYRHTLQYL